MVFNRNEFFEGRKKDLESFLENHYDLECDVEIEYDTTMSLLRLWFYYSDIGEKDDESRKEVMRVTEAILEDLSDDYQGFALYHDQVDWVRVGSTIYLYP